MRSENELTEHGRTIMNQREPGLADNVTGRLAVQRN
jgi:hypothetical protein